MTDLVTRAYETELAWLARGHALRRTKHLTFVREPRAPEVYDANFAAFPRAESGGARRAVGRAPPALRVATPRCALRLPDSLATA